MTPEEQFAEILDQVIQLKTGGQSTAKILELFPEQADELKELLRASEKLEEYAINQAAEKSFSRLVQILPVPLDERDSLRQAQGRLSTRLGMTTKPDNHSQNISIPLFNYMKIIFMQKHVALALCIVLVVAGGYFGTRQNQSGGQNQAISDQTVSSLMAGGFEGESAIRGLQSKDETTIGGARNLQSAGSAGITAPSSEKMIRYEEPMPPDYYPYPPDNGQPTIKDTREFLKTDYNATIRTRDVSTISSRAQTMVRGYGGRLDSAATNERYASLSFAVPQNRFDQFKIELKSLVGKRFYTEAVVVQNMLGQKQNIEEQTAANSSTLASVIKDKTDLTKKHSATVKNITYSLNVANQNIARLNAEAAATTDPARLLAITAQRAAEQTKLRSLQASLASENKNYEYRLAELNNQIEYYNSQAETLAKQDQTLVDSVATVNGTIFIQWISISDLVDIYVGDFWPWLIVIGGLGIIIWFYRQRRLPAALTM